MIKQIGKNPGYPDMVKDMWKYGDPIPEWLSDRAKIQFIDGTGNMTLTTRDSGTGGLEILGTAGEVLVCMKSRSDTLIFSSSHGIQSVTPRQMTLLYEDEKKR